MPNTTYQKNARSNKLNATYLMQLLGSLVILGSCIPAGVYGQATGILECIRRNPTVIVSPTNQSAFPGNQLIYAVTVTNNDSAACPPSIFNAMATFPETGFSHFPDCVTLTLAPGQSGSRTVIIKVPGKACVGSKSFRETAINESTPGFSGFADTVFDIVPIAPDCGVATPTVSIAPSSQDGIGGDQLVYSVTVKSNDNSRCGWSDFIVTPTLSAGLISHTPKAFSLSMPAGGSAFRSVIVRSDLFAISDLLFTETATHTCATCLKGSATGTFSVVGNVVPIRYCCSGGSPDGGATAGSGFTGCTVLTGNSGGCSTGTIAVECTGSHKATPNPPGSGKYDLTGECH